MVVEEEKLELVLNKVGNFIVEIKLISDKLNPLKRFEFYDTEENGIGLLLMNFHLKYSNMIGEWIGNSEPVVLGNVGEERVFINFSIYPMTSLGLLSNQAPTYLFKYTFLIG